MKLQFKVDELLKKVEGLIMKDIAARKEHNRKVGVINSKVEKCLSERKDKQKRELDKVNDILSKYSDDELKGMFLEEAVVTYRGTFFDKTKKTVRPIIHTLDLEGVNFSASIDYGEKIVGRSISIKIYTTDWCRDLIEKSSWLNIVSAKLTIIPEVIKPYKISENPAQELSTLKNKCLQAKSHGIEECTLEDDDLAVLDKYGKVKGYDMSPRYSDLPARNWFEDYKVVWVSWKDIVGDKY